MTIDPIELEIMRNLFEAAAEEMGIALWRTAFSANIKERRDFSCAVFDAGANLLAQAAHIPVHLGSMPASLAAVLKRLGPLSDGDVAIVNDPFAGGTHLPDITLVAPVFHENVLIGYAMNRAHHADVGGISPGSMTLSTHIDEEGIRIEPSFLHRRGQVQHAVLDPVLRAVRTPDERLADLDAQIASNRIGARALQVMANRYGRESLAACGSALMDYARSFMSRCIAGIPDGTYRFEDVLDGDGITDTPIAIRAVVTITDDRAAVDLTDCADQVRGCVNCPASVARAAVYYCFNCLVDESVPLNEGCFGNIEVRTRPGSVVDAQYPAAVVAGNTETSQRIVDVVFGALAQALPGRIPAASCGTMSSVALGSVPSPGTPGEGRVSVLSAASSAWTYYETIGGGSGAGPAWHGESAVQCHMTNTLATSAEALELQYPLRVTRFERAPDSGGAGNFQGGDGIIREIEALADCEGTILSDRRVSRPYGLRGGAPGASGTNEIISDGITPISGKASFQLKPGQRLRITTPGGGGWG
ncbi:MAG: hydantoinase B/oxoprolinase family protein, partial [Tepidisphaeraceae bacterium]